MRILICADAQPLIGTGHLRRMLTLAGALSEISGTNITVRTSELGHSIAAGAQLGMKVSIGSCSPADVAHTLMNSDFDIVILDNYFWNATNETQLRPYVKIICVVDDLADRPHDADVLLDQNAHHVPEDYDGLLPRHCERLVGGQYCLLGHAFTRLPTPAAPPHEGPVFVSLGGGDPHDDLPDVVSAIVETAGLPVTIATGSHIKSAETLREIATKHTDTVELIFNSREVARQMQISSFAVAAGGTMIWERAAIGLPSLCMIVADNQVESTSWLKKREMHEVFDLRGDWSPEHLASRVIALSKDNDRRETYAQNSRRLVARDGAVRVARALIDKFQQS